MDRSPSSKRSKQGSATSPEGALRFPFSPKQINRQSAFELKKRDPSLHLRLTSSADVPPEEENITPGFMLSVWPRPTGRTDKLLEELTGLRKEVLGLREEVLGLKMYSVLCGTSVLVCAADVINFVIKILDHSLKLEVACFPDFEATLVGEKAKKPFQTSVGDGIRYTILLKFVAYLRGDLRVQEKEARKEDHRLLSSCLLLLENAEKRVFGIIKAERVVIKNIDGQVMQEAAFLVLLRGEVLKYCNLEGLWSNGREGQSKSRVSSIYRDQRDSVSSIQKDQQDSVSSIHKDDRDSSAHPFSTLMWTEYKKPLVRTLDDAASGAFPKPSSYFQERNLAKTALLLQDLESKFQNDELGLAAEYVAILPLGFFLVKTFIRQHNKVERSVAYNKIQAVIPGKVKNKDLPILMLSDSTKRALCLDTVDA